MRGQKVEPDLEFGMNVLPLTVSGLTEAIFENNIRVAIYSNFEDTWGHGG